MDRPSLQGLTCPFSSDGEQSFFPVYEPSQEDLLARLREAEGPRLTTHYDATGENRARAAGAYQFSLDEEERRRQMDELKSVREETERKRKEQERGMSPFEIGRKRKLDERRAQIEAKRLKVCRIAIAPSGLQ